MEMIRLPQYCLPKVLRQGEMSYMSDSPFDRFLGLLGVPCLHEMVIPIIRRGKRVAFIVLISVLPSERLGTNSSALVPSL